MATKISISMNEQLLARADKYCEDTFQTRSGLISLALKQYLDGQLALDQIGKMSDMVNELKEIAAIAQQQPPQQPSRRLVPDNGK